MRMTDAYKYEQEEKKVYLETLRWYWRTIDECHPTTNKYVCPKKGKKSIPFKIKADGYEDIVWADYKDGCLSRDFYDEIELIQKVYGPVTITKMEEDYD